MKSNLKRTFLTLALASSMAVPLGSSAHASRIEAGVLTCNVDGGSGFVLGSRKEMDCTFDAIDGLTETYSGVVKKFGIDIGSTDTAIVKWVVFAPTVEMETGALSGNYVGVSGEATVGVGLGANALVGGSNRSIALQPFSGQVQSGLNIAVGIGTMSLTAN